MSEGGSRKAGARPSSARSPSASEHDPAPETAALPSRGNLHASSKQDFDAFVRLVRSTVGEPPSFATPVDAREEGDWYVVAFLVPGRDPADLSVTGSEHSLIVLGARRGEGPKRERRMCTLPDPIDSESLEVVRTDDVLTVRVRKKAADRAAKGRATR